MYLGYKTKDIQSFIYARMYMFWKENKRQTKLFELYYKNLYSLNKNHNKYVYFWERKHKTYKVVFNIKIFAY